MRDIKSELEETYPNDVYSTTELQENFTVLGFSSPYVTVTRKADGLKGSLEFIHMPRFYFNFKHD